MSLAANGVTKPTKKLREFSVDRFARNTTYALGV